MFPVHDDNPVEQATVVSWVLIGSCSLVFLWQSSQTPYMQQVIVYALGVITAVWLGDAELAAELHWVPTWATVFTSMFLHGGWLHLIGNMLYLWVFANNIEAAMGSLRFIVFYALCGVAAALSQGLMDIDSEVPMIGASGAISGVLGAYMLLFPRARVLIVIPIVIYLHTMRVPAVLVLAVWFVMQLVSSFTAIDTGGGIAFGAHIGGFLAGMALIGLFTRPGYPIQLPFLHYDPFRPR